MTTVCLLHLRDWCPETNIKQSRLESGHGQILLLNVDQQPLRVVLQRDSAKFSITLAAIGEICFTIGLIPFTLIDNN